MQEGKFEFDLYDLYDRFLEGVTVDVTVWYDVDHMVENQIINADNLGVRSVRFTKDAQAFVSSNPIDQPRVLHEVRLQLEADNFDMLQEYLTENVMADTEYDRIAHLYAAKNAKVEIPIDAAKVITGANIIDELAKAYEASKERRDRKTNFD